MSTATAEPISTFDPHAPVAMQALAERYERLMIDHVVPSRTNPRTHFAPAYITELAGSIREKGVLQPILVRQLDTLHAIGRHAEHAATHRDTFEIVAGECRWRASKEAGLSHIPAIIRDYSDEQVLELQLEENIHRNDLTPLEEARGYRALIATNPDKHTAQTIADRIGMSVSYVWDRLKLLDLIPEALQLLEEERISVGHAIVIARQKPADQARIIKPPTQQYGYGSKSILWVHEDARLDLDTGKPAKKESKYDGWKPISIRELEHEIADQIRFDVVHAAKAQPLKFEATAAAVEEAEAKPGRGRKVVWITHDYRVSDAARDEHERTYGQNSWKRADGEKSKTCDHSVLGIFAAGAEQGKTLQVCVARDRCKVHWAEQVKTKEKAAELRAKGKTKQAAKVEKKQQAKQESIWEREDRERDARAKAWSLIEGPVIGDALDQVKDVAELTAKHAAALEQIDGELGFDEIKNHLGAKWYLKPAAALLISAVSGFGFHTWGNKESGFDQFVRQIAKPLGLDMKRLESVREQHQPKPAEPVAAAKKSATKSKASKGKKR